jgi:glycyl-tRNA synthetase beta chain
VGIFGINQAPKGDKDPFALRRAAIGLIRIIIEKDLNLDIADLVAKSVALYQDKLNNQDVNKQVLEFVFGRYRAYYQHQNINVDVIQAVLANAPSEPLDFDKRIHAVTHFKTLAEAATLAAANKRVGNILVKFKGELFEMFNLDLATETAEIELATAFSVVKTKIAPLMVAKDYQGALTELSALKQPIDNFFDHVMVMADDEQVKTNRLTLLNEIRNSFFAIADISLLQ